MMATLDESELPKRAADAPCAVTVQAGESYWWCSCGLSANQPFCDGSHKKTANFTPLRYVAEASGERWFCACKRSGNAPLCDGSHRAPPPAS